MKRLDGALAAGDVARSAATAKRLARAHRSQVVSRLLEALRDDDDPGVKNAAAVALRDLREGRAIPVLMGLIQRQEYRNRRGTLVYAVGPLPWERRFATAMASLVCCDDNFEVREMAIKAFEQRVENLSSAQRLQITKYLTHRLYRSRLSLEAGEAAAHVVAVLAEGELGERAQARRRSA